MLKFYLFAVGKCSSSLVRRELFFFFFFLVMFLMAKGKSRNNTLTLAYVVTMLPESKPIDVRSLGRSFV